jgi:hypothetical protein
MLAGNVLKPSIACTRAAMLGDKSSANLAGQRVASDLHDELGIGFRRESAAIDHHGNKSGLGLGRALI